MKKIYDIIVIGGGNTALEEALYLSLLYKKVYLIHRQDRFKGEKVLQDRVFSLNNIRVLFKTKITALYGDKKLERITILRNSSENCLDVNGIFVAIGQISQHDISYSIKRSRSRDFFPILYFK